MASRLDRLIRAGGSRREGDYVRRPKPGCPGVVQIWHISALIDDIGRSRARTAPKRTPNPRAPASYWIGSGSSGRYAWRLY